jgi:alpha-glucosidase
MAEVERVTETATGAEGALWWQSGVVYQIYPRSYQDSNGDGIGDLRGVIQRLDYLADTLGIDALWLSPFYPSPMADFGYDVSDYCDVHPMFGDLATFDELVREAHARGLKVIVDFVPNHCSVEHPWFMESRSSRDNPKRDWFYWKDAREDGSPPNNWLAAFGGPAWEWDETTQQYYLHMFLPEQPDLNWRNPEVKEAMLDAIRFWLARGVDGLRIDALHYLMKDPEYRDNPPYSGPRLAHKALGEWDSFNHIHTSDHPDIHPILREMREVFDAFETGPEDARVAIGEVHVFNWERWSAYYGPKGTLDELHLPFNFALLKAEWGAKGVREVVQGLEAAIDPNAWPNYVLGNHDEPRIATKVGPEAARLAMMLLLTLRGTPTIYQGDELGMVDVPVPPEKVQDPWGLRVEGLGLGRDPQRVPMLWDSSPNAGFTTADADPWLPIAENYADLNVEAQLADDGSMLTLTRKLLKLRKATNALTLGSYRAVDPGPDDCFVYFREGAGEQYLIALSFSDQERTIPLPNLGRGTILISTHLDRDGEVDTGALDLRPHEGVVMRIEG